MSYAGDEYPEVLRDLADHLARLLAEEGIAAPRAAEIAFRSVEEVRKNWGGQLVYVPKGLSFELSARDLEIYTSWNGRNTQELCRKYDISQARLNQIVRAMREKEVKKRQRGLFDG